MHANLVTQTVQSLLVVATIGLLFWPLLAPQEKREAVLKQLTFGFRAFLVFALQLVNLLMILSNQWSPFGNFLKIVVILLAIGYLLEWLYAHHKYAHD